MKKPRQKLILMAISAFLIVAFALSPFGEFALWQFDLARGFKQQCVVYQDEDLRITFTQEADGDFYLNRFVVKQSDGSTSTVQLDHDDARWWNPKVHVEDSRYVVTGTSPWRTPPASHFNLHTRELYSGRYDTFFTLNGDSLRVEK